MRCFACDRVNSTHNDGDTKRVYCTTCWNAIEEAVGLTKKEESDSIEVLVEEEFDEPEALTERRRTGSDAPEM